MSRCFFEIEPALAFAVFDLAKKLSDLVDRVLVSGDEVVFGEDDVELASVGRPLLHIKQGDMNREENAAIILEDPWLIRRGDEFFEDDRMDIEILVEVGDVVFGRRLEINPREVLVRECAHFVFLLPSV